MSLLVLPVSGQMSNVWDGVGGEYMASPPVADHCSECRHSCNVVTDREHSSAWTALSTFGERPRMADTGTLGYQSNVETKTRILIWIPVASMHKRHSKMSSIPW